jgi:hypothetical protein
MTPHMAVAFFFSLFAFTVLYFCFLANRLRLAKLEAHVDELKAEALAA